jgi:hypothetical protein
VLNHSITDKPDDNICPDWLWRLSLSRQLHDLGDKLRAIIAAQILAGLASLTNRLALERAIYKIN